MIKHFLYTSGTNVMMLFISILQGVMNARILHAEGKGLVVIYMSLYSMIYAFSNLGIRQSSSYYYSKENMNSNDIFKVHSLAIIISSIFTSCLLLISFYYQGIFNKNIFIYFILMLPLALYTTFTTSFALSNKWISRLNVVKLVTPLSFFIILLIIYFIFDKKNVESYFLAQLLAYFVTSLYVYSWARKIDGFTYSLENVLSIWKNYKKIISKGIIYASSLFVFGINFKIDIIILNNMVSLSEIGVYSIGVAFAELIWQLPAVLSMLIFSYSVSDNNEKQFSLKLWNKNKKIMLLLIPVLIIYALLVKYILPILYGIEFLNSYLVTFLLLPGTYAIVSFNIFSADLAAKGKPYYALIVFSIFAIINILFNYFLIPLYGINGAAIASSISYILASVIYIIIYYRVAVKI